MNGRARFVNPPNPTYRRTHLGSTDGQNGARRNTTGGDYVGTEGQSGTSAGVLGGRVRVDSSAGRDAGPRHSL